MVCTLLKIRNATFVRGRFTRDSFDACSTSCTRNWGSCPACRKRACRTPCRRGRRRNAWRWGGRLRPGARRESATAFHERVLSYRSPSARAAEPLAILSRRDADMTQEKPPHGFGRAQAGLRDDGFESVRRLLEKTPRGLDSRGSHEARRGRAHLAGERPREIPGTHGHAAGQRGHREIRFGMFQDVGLKLLQGDVL